MGFVAGLLRRLYNDRQISMSAAASEVYTDTLYRYHGWMTSAAFTVALKVSHLLHPSFKSMGSGIPMQKDCTEPVRVSSILHGK